MDKEKLIMMSEREKRERGEAIDQYGGDFRRLLENHVHRNGSDDQCVYHDIVPELDPLLYIITTKRLDALTNPNKPESSMPGCYILGG